MTLPYIPEGVDRREVIWPNQKLVVPKGTSAVTAQPQVGNVTITAHATTVTVKSTDPMITLTNSPVRVPLAANGVMSVYLVCTDDPDIAPNNSWSYTFTGDWQGAPTITAPVPKVAVDPVTGEMPPLNLSMLVSAVAIPGQIITKGDKGDTGATIASIDDDGTVHLTNGATIAWPQYAEDRLLNLALAISL